MSESDDVAALTPSPWLLENGPRLPSEGAALDLACGRGHNALFLATRGFRVRAVDRDETLVKSLRDRAENLRLPLFAEVSDLEDGPFPFEQGGYAVIAVFHYLHRPLFPTLEEALAPGGILVYETFTRAQAKRGHPRNPDHLLEPGELRSLTAGLATLSHREGDCAGRSIASLVAQKIRSIQ